MLESGLPFLIRFQCGNTGCKALAICSIFVIFAPYEVTVWESVWTQFSILAAFCMKSGNCK